MNMRKLLLIVYALLFSALGCNLPLLSSTQTVEDQPEDTQAIEVIDQSTDQPPAVPIETDFLTGTVSLTPNQTLDLDSMSLESYSATDSQDPVGADLLFTIPYENENFQFLEPTNSALLALVDQKPDFQTCAKAFARGEDQLSIPLDHPSVSDPGWYFCYQTDEGRLGYFLVSGEDFSYEKTFEFVEINFITWEESPAQAIAQPQTGIEGDPDLMILHALLRYDGTEAQGTFEITVCNLGTGSAAPFEASITINGVEQLVAYPEMMAPQTCDDVFVPDTTFETFGITEPGKTTLQAAIIPQNTDDPDGNNTLEQSMSITDLATLTEGELVDLAQYQECRLTQSHTACSEFVADAPLNDPHEVKKQLDNLIVIAPAEFDQIANMKIMDMGNCLGPLTDYLGISFPLSHVRQRLIDAANPNEGAHNSLPEIGYIVHSARNTIEASLRGEFPHEMPFTWQNIIPGKCADAHELTHVFMGNTPLPTWMDEGLATYMDEPERSDAAHAKYFSCSPEGWVDWVYYSDGSLHEKVTYPFVDLSVPLHEAAVDESAYSAQSHYYRTGMCFWDYVECNFGHEAFQRVIQALDAQRGNQGCLPFLSEIVNPVLGADISTETQARFGFGLDETNCDF